MGGGSSSSTSSNASTVETDNSNIQQNENAVAFNLEDLHIEADNLTGSDIAVNFSDSGAIQEAFSFSSDTLDHAFNFGAESLNALGEFSEDILQETADVNREALAIAGNAQTNAFKKIKDIAAAFTDTSNSHNATILLALAGGVMLMIIVFLLRKK